MTSEVGRGAEGGGRQAARPPELEPYLRGARWGPGPGAPYPRANPADFTRLPIDTWGTAQLPVGVRLEWVGDAPAVRIAYTCATEDLGYRGAGAGTTFAALQGDTVLDEQPASVGGHEVTLDVAAAAPGERVVVHLPEGMKPLVHSLVPLDGAIEPAPPQPRWTCYGDSIAEGWVAAGPAGAWPAIAGRRFGLDVVNMGYAGAARGEIVSAEHVASLEADVISVSHGTNCWTRIAHSVDQMAANTDAFLRAIRDAHPDTPLVVCSPVLRPDAEATPNRFGATLADLRRAMEQVAQARIDGGDRRLVLVSGDGLLDASQLPDGIHPGDDGHRVMADVFGGAVAQALRTS